MGNSRSVVQPATPTTKQPEFVVFNVLRSGREFDNAEYFESLWQSRDKYSGTQNWFKCRSHEIVWCRAQVVAYVFWVYHTYKEHFWIYQVNSINSDCVGFAVSFRPVPFVSSPIAIPVKQAEVRSGHSWTPPTMLQSPVLQRSSPPSMSRSISRTVVRPTDPHLQIT